MTINPPWDCWYSIGENDCDKYEAMQIVLREINSSSPYQETSSYQFSSNTDYDEDVPF
jgi:hypothetical protein